MPSPAKKSVATTLLSGPAGVSMVAVGTAMLIRLGVR